ncbi:MAG: sigma factor-like helix-turn-helix DNA-binding protein [bacterium]|nr:sigma factor-like helix-turn-helix DNA-binding protein [bacterium]
MENNNQIQNEKIQLIEALVHKSLQIIGQPREQEIITRRFGLNEAKETLEQIGERLDITRERVRQLEKAALIRLKISAEKGEIEHLAEIEKVLIRHLAESGRISKTKNLVEKYLEKTPTEQDISNLLFIAEISSKLVVVQENDKYFSAIANAEYGDERKIKSAIDEIVNIIKKNKSPMTLDELDSKLSYEHPSQIEAIASVSKNLASLNNLWGLEKWPSVNPKNIRDKIFVILGTKKEPMHFSEIAKEIRESDFSRKDVTTQAIHNELIKDKRFVLIGRGIYALDDWGFKKGTVADTITAVLEEAGEPLYRDEIVKRVLEKRKVKETTVLLNLQSKKEFVRVAKATYGLAKNI